MRERFLTWLSSLRIRFIITFVLVAMISFGMFYVLLNGPLEKTLMFREEQKLVDVATTLGTTIRTPWRIDADAWQSDLFWTQRRCHDLAPAIRAHVRLLDANGRVLTDSLCRGSDHSPTDLKCNRRRDIWEQEREHYPILKYRYEIQEAILGRSGRSVEREPNGNETLYVAKPILRDAPPGEGGKRVAFIFYLNKPLKVMKAEVNEYMILLHGLFFTSMLASLLVSVLVSIVLSGPLSSGLRAAMQVARSFAAGHMDQRMRFHGRDEVGQLSIAFNQMADALQRHEQLRRDLLADVSHELRTPLTAIAGCADTLADGVMQDDPVAGARFLDIINKESERLQRLVADILELSKLQAGAVPIPREPLDLRPLLTDAVEIALLHARQDGINIVCDSPEEQTAPLFVLGNEDRLMQALRNLLDNALHHSPAGATVTVNFEPAAKIIVIRVRDEGEGIPPEHLPWVFDRFYRAGKGAKPGGTGLGLAIVREIILAHEGQITVDSTIGQGTTFSLHLPRMQAEGTNN